MRTVIQTCRWQEPPPPGRATLLRRQPTPHTHLTGLPPDLEAQSARRLRIVAVLYAFVFSVSGPVTAMLDPERRLDFFSSVLQWGPPAVFIPVALLVAASTWSKRLPVGTVLTVGLCFQVVGSFGIAAAEYLDADRFAATPPWAGLSWVAVWMLGFTVMIATPPRKALVASLASASAVPLVALTVMLKHGDPSIALPAFFVLVVLPYLLVVLIAYVSARVIYGLGAQLKRAQDLGSYRLIERIGQGGMGDVWLARHRLLARPAAVKLMRPDRLGVRDRSGESELRTRFNREAQATSSLRSPHTIELFDFGVSDDGTFYYVMELLDGMDLHALIQRVGSIPAERAIHVLKQVCHSLAEAHERGLVHRDVKPANVYVCRYGRDVDFVKVLDFGLVKPQFDRNTSGMDITAEYVARGTPAFMSPEQVVGSHSVDARSDIYAVGCLGYWLVTGQHVFAGRTMMDTIVQHIQAQPEPPSRHSQFPIPESFDALILACLAKDPGDRPASADEVVSRLCAVETPTAWTPERALQWWNTHHPAVTSGILLKDNFRATRYGERLQRHHSSRQRDSRVALPTTAAER